MKVTLIWKKLLLEERRFITSKEIRELARELGKGERNSVGYLQRHGYIIRVLRGIFYVRSTDERERDGMDLSIYELVARALKLKGIKRWYVGLESGLKFNNMTHEYFNIEYVITDSYRTTKTIRILDSNFNFLKRSKDHFGFGIVKRKNVFFSDPEKTVLDLTHKGYLKGKESNYFLSPIWNYEDTLDMDKLTSYLEHYPRGFRETVGGFL